MPFPIAAVAGLALGGIGAFGKILGRGKANREMTKLQKEDSTYAANPLAAERLALSRTLLNARMPGSAQRAAQGLSIGRGRPASQTSARQAKLAAKAAKIAAGIEIKRGAPKKTKTEAVMA